MVSRKPPGERRAPRGPAPVPKLWLAVEGHLRDLVAQHRRDLFEPWREVLARSPDLQAEVDATVESLQVFFNKWVVEIVMVLGHRGTLRFNEIKGSLEGISSRTLSQRLRDLETQGLVARRLYDERPIRVEYALTPRGQDVAALALPLVLYLRLRSQGGRE